MRELRSPNPAFPRLRARRAGAVALALAAGLLAAGPARATPGQIHLVDRAAVNLRAGPGTETEIIGRLRRGDRVMEFERRGDWVRVRPMGRVGREGWVHGELLAPEARAPAGPGNPTAEGGPAPVTVTVEVTVVDDDDGGSVLLHRGFPRKFRRFKRFKRKKHGGKPTEPMPEPSPRSLVRPRVTLARPGADGG